MKVPIRKLFFTAGLGLIICSGVQAADVELDKIVVTASRTADEISDVPRDVDVVTGNDIERTQFKDLGEALSDLTSVNISDNGGLGEKKSIRMRGSTASQVLILQDGRPLNNPRDGEVDLSSIPLGNIERVEVVRGPSSSLYGSGAMGGTVNIITKNPPKDGQKTELYSSFGTFRTYDERFSNGAKISKFGYLINGEYESSSGFRANSELDTKDANAKLEYELNDNNRLCFNSGWYRSRAGSPGPLYSADIDDKQKSLKNFQDFNWSFQPDETAGLALKVYQNYDRLQFFSNSIDSQDEILNGIVPYTIYTHTTKARGYDLQLNKRFSQNYQAIGGFNYVGNFNDSTSSGKHKYNVRAGYLENKVDFDKLKFNLSGRVDDYSTFGTKVNPSFEALYELRSNIRIHGSVSRSFRSPTFNDLYWPDMGWTKGNPNLRPERGLTQEVGVQAEINKYLDSELTCYQSEYRDLINWAPDASGLVWQPMNVNSAVIDGIEFGNKIKITPNWGFDGNYTYLMARDKNTHKYLIYQPQNKVDFSLKYNDLKGFTCRLKWQFTGKRFNDPGNTIKVKNFCVLGFDVSKKFNHAVTCFASIDNLLAREYQVLYGFPMPGFSLTVGLKKEF